MDELDKIQGNGYLGRLSKKDIQRYITQKKDGVNAPSVTVAKKTEPVVEERVQPPVVSSDEDQIVGNGSCTAHHCRPYGTVQKDLATCYDFR